MIRLEYHGKSLIPVEAECLTPEKMAGKTAVDVAKLLVQHGNRQVPLGDFFSVSGESSDHEISITGDCSRVNRIGAGMNSGRITIHGNAGMHLGSAMRGGEIIVHGDADDWVGAEMRGGRIRIHGNSGDFAGGAYQGSGKGMRGGELLIDGNAGNEVGAKMRRGLIAIGRDAGDFTGANMIAGSVFVFGKPGIRAGAGMKRGTVALLGTRPTLLPTFRFDCRFRPAFLQLYLRRLSAIGFPFDQSLLSATVDRYSGDFVSLGKGEILLRANQPLTPNP